MRVLSVAGWGYQGGKKRLKLRSEDKSLLHVNRARYSSIKI